MASPDRKRTPALATPATPATPAPRAPAPRVAALAAPPLYLQVAEQLRARIFDGQLAPGAWVDELRLAAEFGISRTPLREALKVLAVEGLVTMKPRRGAYVAEASRHDVADVYHLLALLEADAAADAARHASEADLARLQTLHAALEAQTRRRDAFLAANEAFHIALLQVAGNRWRQQIVADLRKVMKLNRHHSLVRAGRIAESLAEHRDLMASLRARDADAARRLTRAHFHAGLAAATGATNEV